MDPKSSDKHEHNQTRKREPRCWSCANDRKGCNVEKYAPDLSPCLRCRELKHKCTDEAPKDRKTKPQSRLKCMQCRQRHIKCIFPDGETPIKCEHCKSRNLDCSQPQERVRVALPTKRRAQQDNTSSPTKRRAEISSPSPAIYTASATPASEIAKTVSASTPDDAVGSAKKPLDLGVTLADSNSPPSAAGATDKTPQLAAVNPGTDHSTPPGTLGIEATTHQQRLNPTVQLADGSRAAMDKITEEPSVECDLLNPAISKSLVRFFVRFSSQNPELNQIQCMEFLETTCLSPAKPITARLIHEASVPTLPQLQSDITRWVSVRGALPCLSSGSPPTEFRTRSVSKPRNIPLRRVVSTSKLQDDDLLVLGCARY